MQPQHMTQSNKSGLARRHDSQFDSNLGGIAHAGPAHPDPTQPRRVPVLPHNNTGNTPQGSYSYNAHRFPEAIIEELPSEAPTQAAAPGMPQTGGKFQHSQYSNQRNLPAGTQAPEITQTVTYIKQNGPKPFTASGPVPGQNALMDRDQAMRQTFQAQRAEPDKTARMPQQATAGTGPPLAQGNQGGRAQTQAPPRNTRSYDPHRPPQAPSNSKQASGQGAQGMNGQLPAHQDPKVETFGIDQPIKPGAGAGGKRGRGIADVDGMEQARAKAREAAREAEKKETEKKEVARKEAERKKNEPKRHFVPAQQLGAAHGLACQVQRNEVWVNRLKAATEAYRAKQAGDVENKEFEWSIVSDIVDDQDKALHNVMEKYNELLLRFNALVEIKNTALEEKQDLTDRYRRAGATLSTQCVSLQTSTHQVKLSEVKRRRLISDGRAET